MAAPSQDPNSQPAALADPAQLYRFLTETAPDAIITIDEASTILTVNPAAEAIFGYSSAELVGRPLYVLMPERLQAGHRTGMARYLATGQRRIPWRNLQLPVMRKGGVEFLAEISFGEFSAGGQRLFSGFIRDVTARVAAEQALEAARREAEVRRAQLETLNAQLREKSEALESQVEEAQALSEELEQTNADLVVTTSSAQAARQAAEESEARSEQLQAITAALSATLSPLGVATVVVERGIAAVGAQAGAVAMLDSAGTYLSLLRAVGYPADALERFRHIPLDAAFPLAEAVKAGEPIILATAAERARRYPHLLDLRRANGNGGMVAIPLVVDGRTVGVLGMNFPEKLVLDEDMRDFLIALAQQCALALDRARLYEAEQEARKEADAANRAKSEFLAVMSHELRTPLNAIAGYAELMELGVPEPIPQAHREYLTRIQHAQRHLLALINSVLNFAKLEAGHIEFDLAPVAVTALLRTVEPLVAPQVRAKGHELRIATIDDGLLVHADSEKASQILVNLLANAVKFTPAGGRITVDAEAVGANVAIRVSDSGIGIPAGKLESIFDPFVQIDKQLTRTSEGVGLGLAISRDLALAMRGDITAASTPGKGSVFSLVLPRGERPGGA